MDDRTMPRGGAPDAIRVLVVDDNPEICDNISMMLSLEDDIVVVGRAGTARDAVLLAGTLKPDVALLDLHLPDLDGCEAAKALLKTSPRTCVLCMSVEQQPAELRRMAQAGACGFLSKPLAFDLLCDSIRRHAP
ncbi:MAG: response regulator transcription factor [Anaerolineae bacterium]|nr:response regulator transcription factor [Anaerolineae bacterium]